MKFAYIALLGLADALKVSETTCPTCPGIPDQKDFGQWYPENCRLGEGGFVYCKLNGVEKKVPDSSPGNLAQTCPTCPGIPDGKDYGQWFPESCRQGEGGWVLCKINGKEFKLPGTNQDGSAKKKAAL